MKEFIEKLIGRLEESTVMMASSKEFWNNPQNGNYVREVIPKETAIEIVNQLAEEHKCGWIPCSERLPEEAGVYEVTEEVFINSTKQYIVEHRLFGTEGEWLRPSNRKVIAWMPLPAPYK